MRTHDLGLPLDDLVRETRRAIEGWDWSRGAYGHALSLPAYADLHPYGRYLYGNFPCADLLAQCPVLRNIFESLRCEKVSFRLLRRGPSSSYAWHTDQWKGPGVVRFQIPIISDDAAFLVVTDYDHVDHIRGDKSDILAPDAFTRFAAANAGHFTTHHLERGVLHYFNTSRVHTLVNPGAGERITLSFDLVTNDWVRARFPEIREEIGDGPIAPLPRPGRLRSALGFASARLHPLKTRAHHWLGERHAGQKT